MREFAETEFLPDTKDRFNLSCILLKSETRGYLLPPSALLPIVVVHIHIRLCSPLCVRHDPAGYAHFSNELTLCHAKAHSRQG